MLDHSSKSSDTHLCFPSLPNDQSDSGVSSLTLWRTSPPKSHHHHHHRSEDYWSLSPDSKAEAIARGQRELMDMVSKMPESCYELSLKDLVELRRDEEIDRKVFDELPNRTNMPDKVVRKRKSDKWVDSNRNSGVNYSGFLLNMIFPFSLGFKKNTKKKKKKKSSGVTIKDSQVSPRPSISDESVKAEDKDWGNKLSDEPSSKTSGSSRSSRRDQNSSCFSFFWSAHSRD